MNPLGSNSKDNTLELRHSTPTKDKPITSPEEIIELLSKFDKDLKVVTSSFALDQLFLVKRKIYGSITLLRPLKSSDPHPWTPTLGIETTQPSVDGFTIPETILQETANIGEILGCLTKEVENVKQMNKSQMFPPAWHLALKYFHELTPQHGKSGTVTSKVSSVEKSVENHSAVLLNIYQNSSPRK